MRILKTLVGVESVVLVALVVWLVQRDQTSPVTLPPTPAVSLAASPMEAGAVGNAAPAAGERRELASAPASDAVTSGARVVLQGRLLGVDPLPKDGAVRLSLRRDETWRNATVRDGVFAIAGLRPGTWRVRCEVDGCVLQQFEHVLDATPVQRRDIELQPAVVLPVFVRTVAGARLQAELAKLGVWQGLQVVATEAPLAGDLEPTESSSVGDVGLGRHRQSWDLDERADDKAGDGKLELDRPPPVFASLLLRHMVLATQRIEPGQTELKFAIDPAAVQAKLAKVRLRVVDDSGQPLAKARVEFSTAQGGGAQKATGDDGIAEVGNVLPGLAHVTIWAKDREHFSDHMTFAPGAVLDLGDVRLTAARQIRGRAVDADGRPRAANLQWTAIDSWRPPHPMQDRRSAPADGDGNFELQLGDRRYVVRARTDDGQVGYATVDARTVGEERFVVTMRPTTQVTLDVRGNPLATYAVVVRDSAGLLLDVRRVEVRWRESSLQLPPGDYRIEIHDGAGRLVRRTTLAVGSQCSTLEVP